MYVDLLDGNNYLHVNISLIQKLGLECAVYCTELFTIARRASVKNKLVDDGCVKVDRDYIKKVTSLSEAQQLDAETKLADLGLLVRFKDKKDTVCVNSNGIGALVVGGDLLNKNDIEELKKKINSKETKKQTKIQALKSYVTVRDALLKEELDSWVEAVYNSGRKLTRDGVIAFVKGVLSYSTDFTEQFKIIKCAKENNYIDVEFCIDKLNRLKKADENNKAIANTRTIRVTNQVRATQDDIDNGDKF